MVSEVAPVKSSGLGAPLRNSLNPCSHEHTSRRNSGLWLRKSKNHSKAWPS